MKFDRGSLIVCKDNLAPSDNLNSTRRGRRGSTQDSDGSVTNPDFVGNFNGCPGRGLRGHAPWLVEGGGSGANP
jgi:hypothetical protein